MYMIPLARVGTYPSKQKPFHDYIIYRIYYNVFFSSHQYSRTFWSSIILQKFNLKTFKLQTTYKEIQNR